MSLTNAPGAIIKYIGTESSYTDPVAGTGTWVTGEQRTVDDDIGQVLASNTYKFQKVSDSGVVEYQSDPVTGGSIISTPESTLKLPAGELDLSALSGGISVNPVIGRSVSASFTFDSADAGRIVKTTAYAATTATIPLDSTVDFDVGASLYIYQGGQGQVTIAGAAGVSLQCTEQLLSKGWRSIVCATKIAANTWIVTGQLAPGYSIGAELLTNGNFAAGATGWTVPNQWAVAGGKCTQTGTPGQQLKPSSNPFVTGSVYRCTFDVLDRTVGHVVLYVGGAAYIDTSSGSAVNGTWTADLTAPADVSYYGFVGSSGFNGSVTNVSVRKLT